MYRLLTTDMAEPTTHRQRFGSAYAEAFTAELQNQNQKTKQANKYSVKVLQDYMSEKNVEKTSDK